MSDNWEVKKVEKSGDGFWINIVPSYRGEDGNGGVHLFNMIILSLSFMHVFGATGFGWWVFWAVISLIISVVLYIPSLVISLIILGFFIFT
jgi:hypothetical protein